MSLISPSTLILEIGRNGSGQGSGDLDYSLKSARLYELNDKDLADFKYLLMALTEKVHDEQLFRQLKKAGDVPV